MSGTTTLEHSPTQAAFQEAAAAGDFLKLLLLFVQFFTELKDGEAHESDNIRLDGLISGIFPDYKTKPETVSAPVRESLASLETFSRKKFNSPAERQKSASELISGVTGKISDNGKSAILTHLLNPIAQVESGGNYNIAYGGRTYDLVNMTIDEVRKLQKQIVAKGGASSAMGRYQIMGYTMNDLIEKLNLTGKEKFDAGMQDLMAVTLAERRGLTDFLAGKMTVSRFANNLSQEWAGLKNSSGHGHYDGDGLNKGTLDIRNSLTAMQRTTKVATLELE